MSWILRDQLQAYRVACARVATHAIFAARWRRDIFEKSHHHRKQKIVRVLQIINFQVN